MSSRSNGATKVVLIFSMMAWVSSSPAVLGFLYPRGQRGPAVGIRSDELAQLVCGSGDVLRGPREERIEAAFMWSQPERHLHCVPRPVWVGSTEGDPVSRTGVDWSHA